ncbi:MAG: hypothetical protein ACM33B_06510 [Pseudomonadota bacterium]
MSARLLAVLSVAAALTGCGGDEPSAEGVVRAWAESVRLGHVEAAARLLAPGAEVIDGDRRLVLRTEGDALRYSRREACAGAVVRIEEEGGTVEAEFDVGPASLAHCEGAVRERALFRVRDGKITFLHRLPSRERVRVV